MADGLAGGSLGRFEKLECAGQALFKAVARAHMGTIFNSTNIGR